MRNGVPWLNLTAPVRVAMIDVAGPLADLDCGRAERPPYTAAWILVCRAGHPIGSIEIPLHDPVITVAELEREVSRQLGQDGQRGVQVAHQPPPLPLSRASVVVPTNLARPAELRRCLKSLAELDHPNYEVIVVDNRPADAPPADIEGARVVREPRPGASAARNRGASVATGEIIAFTDDDIQAHPGWLSALGSRFARQPHISAVTGMVVPLELETQAQILFEQSGSGPERGCAPLTFARAGRFMVRRCDEQAGQEQVRSLYLTGDFGLGANMAFRAAVLHALGGFDEALGPGLPTHSAEDLALFVELLAAGHQLGYEPAAIIEHQHRTTMAELDRQIHDYGVGFTAMLTAVALRNPWHAFGLAAVAPAWLRSLRGESSTKSVNRASDYPPALVRAELRGMVAGPLAYLRARRTSPPRRR
jgi:GT2 family glycosyltransferase